MQMTAGQEADPLEVSVTFGTVQVIVTPSAVTYVLGEDYNPADYAVAMQMAAHWPHSDEQHAVIYLPNTDCLVFLRK
jgi:hypothetical protein